MRVAIDCSHHPVPGGVRTYLDNLVPALSRVGPELDLDLYYRTPRSPSVLPEYPHARSRVAHVPGSRRLWSWVERQFDWPPIELHCGDLDVVHGTHFTLPAARRARRVLTVHDVAYLKHPELYADRRLNEYGYRTLLQNSLAGADLVLAISHHTRNDLIVECGVDPERVWVVPFGWDQRLVRRPEEIWRPEVEALGIDRPFVLYPAGSIDVRKNIDRVLEGHHSMDAIVPAKRDLHNYQKQVVGGLGFATQPE
ncbi:MAG: glycosyltransferase, partial [Planctomycetota bacterium]